MISKKFTPDSVFLKPIRKAIRDALNRPAPATSTEVAKTTKIGSTTTRTPSMSEIQKDEDAVRQQQPKKERATEQELREELFHEPPVKKTIQDRSGAEEVGDTWRNPLSPHSPFARNGAKVRGETDSGTGDDTTIRFAGTSDEEKRRQYEGAMKRAASATDDLYQMLEWAKIDVNNLTAEQDDVIDLVKKELIKKSVLGTLTREEKQKILQRTQQYIYNETTSANGDPYPVYIDIVSAGNQLDDLFPALGTVDTDVLSEDELQLVLEYGEQGSADEKEHETFESMQKYKERVTWEAIYAYNKDIALGRAEPGDIQDYYDQAVKKYYDGCFKPIPVQDQRGKEIGSVMIGYLISPIDRSLGAEVARKAMEMMGMNHDDLDCSQLVKWAFSQLNPDWGKYGIGNHAEYQKNKAPFELQKESESDHISESKLKTGDLLYWKDSAGLTVHTAIYLGSGYMIESWHDVRITKLRQETHLGGGEVSTLFQVNRMTEKKLNENVEKYKR